MLRNETTQLPVAGFFPCFDTRWVCLSANGISRASSTWTGDVVHRKGIGGSLRGRSTRNSTGLQRGEMASTGGK